jgi:chorismate dehydratase
VPAPDPPVKLRLVPPETPEELAHRYERERRAVSLQREDQLGSSIPCRIGSVPYLNAVPLTRGLEEQIIYAPPSRLAEMLQRQELDAALVSVTEVLLRDGYDVLDGIAIAALGEVQSVFLAHRRPLSEVREVFCDPASLTSLNLVRVLLAERGLRPEYKPLATYEHSRLPDYVLLIGDPALDFLRAPHPHEIWDLGAAWFELTHLPFVFAVWALRRGIENSVLRQKLREAKEFGLDTLDSIISSRTEYDYNFRKDYLSWHVHFHMGADEKRGLAKFIELLRRHLAGPVFEPRFVA